MMEMREQTRWQRFSYQYRKLFCYIESTD